MMSHPLGLPLTGRIYRAMRLSYTGEPSAVAGSSLTPCLRSPWLTPPLVGYVNGEAFSALGNRVSPHSGLLKLTLTQKSCLDNLLITPSMHLCSRELGAWGCHAVKISHNACMCLV